MQQLYSLLLICVFAFSALQGCSSSSTGDDDDDDNDVTSGITIVGAVTGTADAGLVKSVKFSTKFADFNDNADLCPATEDDPENATSAVNTPSSYTIALKKFTLVGDAEYEVFSADSVDNAYISDFEADTTFFSSETYPTAGTYTGIEIELFYIEMEVPMIIPALGDTEATIYTTRGYFDDVGNVQPRDVTIFSEGTEYWINRQTDSDDPYGLVAVTEDHPFQVLDLWSDENFWGTEDDPREPLTICTEDVDTDTCTGSELGTELTFNMEDEAGLTIPDTASGLYTITMTFDVANRFTFWEYLENGLAADADGIYTVGYDCGYRIFFPDVTITMEESE